MGIRYGDERIWINGVEITGSVQRVEGFEPVPAQRVTFGDVMGRLIDAAQARGPMDHLEALGLYEWDAVGYEGESIPEGCVADVWNGSVYAPCNRPCDSGFCPDHLAAMRDA